MSVALAVLGWSLFALIVLAALLLDLIGLFGNWIILGAVGAAAAISGFDHFGGYTLVILLVLAIFGEVLEALAAGAGAAKYGGGKGAIAAALVGTLVGALLGTSLFPIVGTIARESSHLHVDLLKELRDHRCVVYVALRELGRHDKALVVDTDVQLPPTPLGLAFPVFPATPLARAEDLQAG